MFNLNRISKKFKEDFAGYRPVPMAVYGTGNNARAILMDPEGFDIPCVIVNGKAGGFFFGRPVVSLEEALSKGVAMIVLAAEADVEMLIYNRIKEECREKGVRVFGIHLGDMEDLSSARFFGGIRDGDRVTEADVIRQIENHEVISFNIFDTLLMRRVLVGQDVFSIVGQRLKAEGIAMDGFPFIRLHAQLTNPVPAPSIDEIYAYMAEMAGIDPKTADLMKSMELSAERDVIVPRNEICALFRLAKEAGKKVYLISDTYLTRDVLERLLKAAGVEGYEELIISCEYKVTKNDGLFGGFLRKCAGKRCLHIGSDRKTDGLNPLSQGIDVMVLPSAGEMAEMSAFRSSLAIPCNVNEKSMVGLFVHRLFRNPFCREITVTDSYDYGYLFLGPAVTAFMLWLVSALRANRITRVLFAARDGYLFQRLYETAVNVLGLTDMPAGTYFYTSRRACLRSYCLTAENLDEVRRQYSFTMEDICRNYSDGEYIVEMSEADILKKAESEHAGYQKYIDSLGIGEEDRIAFVDLVSGGTCQYYLERMFLRPMTGLYLCRSTSWTRKAPRISSMAEEYPEDISAYFSKIAQVRLLEAVMTSPEPSLAGFAEDGGMIFLQDSMTEEYRCFVKSVQDGISDYFDKYIRYLYVPDLSIHPALAKILMEFRNHLQIDESILKNIHIDDELMGTRF